MMMMMMMMMIKKKQTNQPPISYLISKIILVASKFKFPNYLVDPKHIPITPKTFDHNIP
jgi:hypothetical protein